LFESTQIQDFDFNGTWQNSLRNNEPDLARNGLDLIKLEGLRKKAQTPAFDDYIPQPTRAPKSQAYSKRR